MIVCHCKGISDKAIRRAVREGASSLERVSAGCGAGAECGGCHEVIRWLIQSEGDSLPKSGGTGLPRARLAPNPSVS